MPFLRFQPALREVQALAGVVAGHPLIAVGRHALTSEL